MKSVGERLDWYRKKRGMSLEELGQFLGYGKAKTAARHVMSRILNDHRKLTLEDLSVLQREGMDLNWLINGVGEIKNIEEADNQEFSTYHFYDGPDLIETVKIPEFRYPEIINMQSKEIFTMRLKTEMMSPTIKINETVNAVRVSEIKQDGLYVSINDINGEDVMWIKRLFINEDDTSFIARCDNVNYPEMIISADILRRNRINLRVFSIMQTVDRI
jgi:transcriptional regulator with XRE-family HTH domain